KNLLFNSRRDPLFQLSSRKDTEMTRKCTESRNVEGVRPYTAPAGGWGALHAVARTIRNQMDFAEGSKLLLKNNQPNGFDCPGCAWPDPTHTSAFEFCENGAK